MRSRPDKIIKLPNARHGGYDDNMRDLMAYGACDLSPYGGGPISRSMVFDNRMAVVYTYLNRKERQGGDPLRSTASALTLPTLVVERVLDVEIGRPPNRVREAWTEAVWHGKNSTSREMAAFMKRQQKLDREWGTAYAKTFE
jgi:hypothetical protein